MYDITFIHVCDYIYHVTICFREEGQPNALLLADAGEGVLLCCRHPQLPVPGDTGLEGTDIWACWFLPQALLPHWPHQPWYCGHCHPCSPLGASFRSMDQHWEILPQLPPDQAVSEGATQLPASLLAALMWGWCHNPTLQKAGCNLSNPSLIRFFSSPLHFFFNMQFPDSFTVRHPFHSFWKAIYIAQGYK